HRRTRRAHLAKSYRTHVALQRLNARTERFMWDKVVIFYSTYSCECDIHIWISIFRHHWESQIRQRAWDPSRERVCGPTFPSLERPVQTSGKSLTVRMGL